MTQTDLAGGDKARRFDGLRSATVDQLTRRDFGAEAIGAATTGGIASLWSDTPAETREAAAKWQEHEKTTAQYEKELADLDKELGVMSKIFDAEVSYLKLVKADGVDKATAIELINKAGTEVKTEIAKLTKQFDESKNEKALAKLEKFEAKIDDAIASLRTKFE
ncbi:MAG: hypothetical protein O3C63_09605 [Cyanobacteria bacterium]|nr:hypothetical protein [Cyanobacteriota bacterium]